MQVSTRMTAFAFPLLLAQACSVKNSDGSDDQHKSPNPTEQAPPGFELTKVTLGNPIQFISTPAIDNTLSKPFIASTQAKFALEIDHDTEITIGELSLKTECPPNAQNAGAFLTIMSDDKLIVTSDIIRHSAEAVKVSAEFKSKLPAGKYAVIPTFYTDSACKEISITFSLVDALSVPVVPSVTPSPTPVPTPTPQDPDPSTVSPVRAYSFKTIHFAYCSAQGEFGVLLDFSGIDVGQVIGAGKVKRGVRRCGSSKPFTWADKTFEIDFVNDGSSSVIRFDFEKPNTGAKGFTIDIESQALEDGRQGNGMIYGNSGPCVFLQNKGTKDLFAGSFFRCE